MKLTRSRTVALCLSSVLASSAAPSGEAFAAQNSRLDSAQGVLQLIDERGAKEALDSLYSDEATWDRTLDAITEGTEAWLRVAIKLRKVSDAGASFDLSLAVSDSLARNPTTVLGALKVFDPQDVCGTYGFPNKGDLRSTIRVVENRVRAVQGVSAKPGSDLDVMKRDCLRHLGALRQRLAKDP